MIQKPPFLKFQIYLIVTKHWVLSIRNSGQNIQIKIFFKCILSNKKEITLVVWLSQTSIEGWSYMRQNFLVHSILIYWLLIGQSDEWYQAKGTRQRRFWSRNFLLSACSLGCNAISHWNSLTLPDRFCSFKQINIWLESYAAIYWNVTKKEKKKQIDWHCFWKIWNISQV